MKTSTIYQKSIRSPDTGTLLKKGSNNKKLGFNIKSKKWRGSKLYSLTLVERETCPTSCHHWDDCYGNNMPFAHRFSTDGLETKLESEIETLLEKHPQGITIRLHVLGDFYSVDYVAFWEDMLFKYKNLTLFGYTARYEDPIGRRIAILNMRFNERCVIRFSRSEEYNGFSFAAEEGFEGASFTCPEQTNRIPSCADCGLCWTTEKTVKFLSH